MENPRCNKYSDSTIMFFSEGIFAMIMAVISTAYSYLSSDFGSLGYFLLGSAAALMLNIGVMGICFCVFPLFCPVRIGDENALKSDLIESTERV